MLLPKPENGVLTGTGIHSRNPRALAEHQLERARPLTRAEGAARFVLYRSPGLSKSTFIADLFAAHVRDLIAPLRREQERLD